MGKISDALEKYRKLRSNRVSGKLRSSDYNILLRFDEASGRLEENAALSKEDSASLQRLMTYRLVDSEGRLTPAGISRLQELHRGQKDFKPSRPEASGAPEVKVPQAKPVPKPDQLSASDWAILMRYDRKSGNLLTYDPETGRLDQNGIAILREPDTVQRLIDAGMIFPGGGLTPEAMRECARIEEKRNRTEKKDSGQQNIPASTDSAGVPFAGYTEKSPKIIRLDEDEKLDEKDAEKLRSKDDSTPAPQTPDDAPKNDGTLHIMHTQLSKKGLADTKPPKSPAESRFDLKKQTAQYDKNAIDKNLVSLFNPESIEAEQFKILRTNLLFPSAGAAPRSIMVTSALPGEGKSFVSANLAISVARHINRSVLLVDCDLRRPTVHQQFGFGETAGLVDYLSRGWELPSLLLNTIVEHLTILPAGKPPANPSELLSSERMYDLLKEVSARYHDRLIIIDSPPPRLAAESSALARQVDGILLVVKYARTPRDMITDLIDKLGPDKVLGAIVNNFEMSLPFYAKRYYGYYSKYYGRK